MGEVVSDSMAKTVTVKVVRTYADQQFHKVNKRMKKYKVHDEAETAKVGDWVEFVLGKPVSKTKYMYLTRVVRSAY